MRGYCLVDKTTQILSQDPIFEQTFLSGDADRSELKISQLFDTTLSFETLLNVAATRQVVPAMRVGTSERFQVEIVPLPTEHETLYVVLVEELASKEVASVVSPIQEATLVGGDRASDLDPFFDVSPLPMWVFNTETLRFLAVNEAAVQKYGWSREEFLTKTILEIRPESERERVGRIAKGCLTRVGKSGPWMHQNRFGEHWNVEILSHAVTYRGVPSRLVKVLELPKEAPLSRFEGENSRLIRSLHLVDAREARIVEMKKEINELLGALGRDPKFHSVCS